MGILDDAIREHLDLKRRRGADPAEIERAERDALGPVRRNRESPAEEDAGEPYAPVGSAYDEPDEGIASDLAEEAEPVTGSAPSDDDPFTEEHVVAAPEPEPEPLMTPEPAADPGLIDEPPSPGPSAGDGPEAANDPFDDDDPFAEDEPFASEPAITAEEDEPRTRVMRTADVPESAASYESEQDLEDDDVLEETPEFLQDTPDHDRLWFEQRPPRDFDFDS